MTDEEQTTTPKRRSRAKSAATEEPEQPATAGHATETTAGDGSDVAVGALEGGMVTADEGTTTEATSGEDAIGTAVASGDDAVADGAAGGAGGDDAEAISEEAHDDGTQEVDIDAILDDLDEDDEDEDDEEDDEDEAQPAPGRRAPAASGAGFTHLNESGRARMVDVGDKEDTRREATARALVRMRAETLGLIRSGGIHKGDVLAVAQVAGVMAAKRTPDIIPLCHTLILTGVDLDFRLDESVPGVEITATVRTTAKTGAEMEALTAVTAAALTVYDMCKSVDREMTVEGVRLLHKAGGKSGEFRRQEEFRPAGRGFQRDRGEFRPREDFGRGGGGGGFRRDRDDFRRGGDDFRRGGGGGFGGGGGGGFRRDRDDFRRDRDREDFRGGGGFRPREDFGRGGGGGGGFRRDDRPNRTWPQHPGRRPDDDEGPRGPRGRYDREPRTGSWEDQRRGRDDQRQGFDRGPRRPWRSDDQRDRGRGRDDGD